MNLAACCDIGSPPGACLLMCSELVSGCITALAIVRCKVRRFILHAPERFSPGSDSLSGLRCELRGMWGCCRPIQGAWQCGRHVEWRGRRVSRRDRSPDDRGYRECISRTWNGRRYEFVRLVPREPC